MVSFRLLNLPASEDIWRQKEAHYIYIHFSISIALYQVTGTIEKPVQSLRSRGTVLTAETSAALPQDSPKNLEKFSWPWCLPHAPWTAVQQTERTGAKEERPRESSCLAYQPLVWGSLGKVCLFLLLWSSDRNSDLDRLSRLQPLHVLWFGAIKAPHQ